MLLGDCGAVELVGLAEGLLAHALPSCSLLGLAVGIAGLDLERATEASVVLPDDDQIWPLLVRSFTTLIYFRSFHRSSFLRHLVLLVAPESADSVLKIIL